MKLGFFTDTHARSDTPEGRTDNFWESLCLKLEETGQIFNNEHVEAVLFGGDLFNTPDPSNSIVHDVMHILKSWGKPIIGVVGSHDYFGYQIKSLKRTALGILVKAGVIELVGNHKEKVGGISESITLGASKGFGAPRAQVVIVGTPHTYWLADDPNNFSYDRLAEKDQLQIQLVHGDLNHKSVPWKHVTIDQVTTESDIILSGHIHPGWDKPLIRGSKAFFNPGSIARLENTGVQRIPRVVIINTEEGATTLRCINLESCAFHPFKEKIVALPELVQDTSRLLELIKNTSHLNKVDIKGKLMILAQETNASKEVIELGISLIEEAEEQ